MTPLPLTFNQNDYGFTQVYREPLWAIYHQHDPKVASQPSHLENPKATFEVVRVRSRAAREVFGRPQPAKEIYPNPDSWGTYGWTVVGTLDQALDFLRSTQERVKAVASRQKRAA